MPLSCPATSTPLPCRPETVEDFLSAPPPAVVAAAARLTGTVLVLGAGGKMGLHLSLMLHKAVQRAGRPVRIIAVSRFQSLRDRERFTAAGIEAIACDLSEPAQVDALPDADTVFFLAGVKFGTGSSPALLERMNVVMPRLVAGRFRGSHIVAFSTGCVYPFIDVNSGGASEATPVAPVGAYAESCLQREAAFAAAARDGRTPVTLIRLNYAVEFRYGVLVDIASKVYAREPVDVTMGHVNVIWQPDAIAQIIQSLAIAGSPAVPLNITGPAVLSVRQLAHDFGARFGVAPTIEGREAPTAWLNDASHSHRLFGLPPTPITSMMSWIAAWLQSGGPLWGKPTGFEKRDGNF